ncbi:helix-turn-helix transcriptional regulator [Patulibacter defluvii]|uniref:helix-turn-helix transcriptional regulator n=1 Tax=Patulibacter defluvii TaxID=3095358 RepID=UPI002A75485D|nr:LuxR C-terminal-related transcriptional regulator [Patulibacter sp. DM4]
MRADAPRRPLIGRSAEIARARAAVDAVRTGSGAALRIEGPPGVGKSALLAAAVPDDLPVLRATGVESEAELPLAGLDELLQPLGGIAPADGADPVILLREVAARIAAAAPLVLLVDDLQWLDPSSRAAVAFLARRASRLRIAVIAVWSQRGEAPDPWPAAETLALGDLPRESALALARDGGLAPAVAEALVDAVGGNALALVEAPRSLSPSQRAGRRLLPDPLPVGDQLRAAYAARVAALPHATRAALLRAAAGAPAALVVDALEPAEDADLVRLDGGVRFVHPLVRSAIYHAAAPSERRAAHRAIAAAVDEPERSWQLALAAPGPDEQLAARLVELAEQARAQGAPGTAAAVLERAARMTPDPEQARARSLGAAATAILSGRPGRAHALLDDLLPGAADPLARADLQLLRGIAIAQTGRPAAAVALLEAEADAIEPADPARASALLTQACIALMGPGPLARLGEIAQRAQRLAPPGMDAIPAVLGAEVLVSLGEHARGRALLDRYDAGLRAWDATAPGHEVVTIAGLGRLWLGDHDAAWALLTRLVEAGRASGAATPLAPPLAVLATLCIRLGRLDEARDLADEALEIADAGLGTFALTLALGAVAMTASHRGDEELCRRAAGRLLVLGEAYDLAVSLACAEQALGHLRLGQGDAAGAVEHLRRSLAHADRLGSRDPAFFFTPADLLEALVRSGRPQEAATVLAALEVDGARTGGAWARAAVARGRGLLGPEQQIGERLAEALAAHADPAMPFEAARTRLALGERLRRSRRRAQAREVLREAHEGFRSIGAASWAARAAAELAATGDGPAAGDDELTARERAVCDLVAAGRTNREVAAELFLSPRTVEHHLRMAYRKLGVRSRTELAARRAGALGDER